MQPRPKLRLWQLSLRTLLVAITLICVASGVYAHWMRPRKLELLVDEFNKKIDERRYDAAYEIALEAKRDYPRHPAAQLLVEKAKFAKQIAYNTVHIERGVVGCIYVIPEPILEPSEADTEATSINNEWWETLAKWKKR